MRLDLWTARVTNVNLTQEPGYVWLTVMLSESQRPWRLDPELRAFRLDSEQLKALLTLGFAELEEAP